MRASPALNSIAHTGVEKAHIHGCGHSDHSMAMHMANDLSLNSNHEIMTVLAALQSLLTVTIMLLLILLHGFLCR